MICRSKDTAFRLERRTRLGGCGSARSLYGSVHAWYVGSSKRVSRAESKVTGVTPPWWSNWRAHENNRWTSLEEQEVGSETRKPILKPGCRHAYVFVYIIYL